MFSDSTRIRLATQLDALPVILDDASDEQLDRRPPSGGWSARENLAHLARYHEVFIERIGRILGEDRPLFERYRAEEDPEWPRWTAMRRDELLHQLRGSRQELMSLVERLTPLDSRRIGVHSVFGEMTLTEWIEFFLVHEAHHLYVVMKRARGGT